MERTYIFNFRSKKEFKLDHYSYKIIKVLDFYNLVFRFSQRFENITFMHVLPTYAKEALVYCTLFSKKSYINNPIK
jgi:hypothetical protein